VANKAGQIIARGERTWLVRVFMGRDPESGKRQYHNKTIRGTRKDAQAYLNQAQRDRDLGMFFEPSRMSLDQYLDKWLETAAKPKLRAKTHRDYEALLKRYVRPMLGIHSVSRIESLDIQSLYTGMRQSARKETFFGGLFARLSPRLGAKAAWAVAHRIARIVWLLLHEQIEYQERGPVPLSHNRLMR